MGDVNGDGEVNIADVNAIINIILNPAPADDHEWVDLGLPSGTLWATCNVGASVPEQYGDYFAWGETTPKEYYDFSTYKWCNGTWNSLTKYCSDSFWGTVDNKRELDSEDDAASANWGSSWRMPSADQMKELCRSCTWQWIQRNGVNGQQVTGPNGSQRQQHIFARSRPAWRRLAPPSGRLRLLLVTHGQHGRSRRCLLPVL